MRPDGKRVKNTDPMYTVVPYIMDKRYDSMNMITLDIPVEPMHAYMNRVRAQGRPVSHMGLMIAAYLRAAAEFPRLNRFIVNKCIYARNEFVVALVVLKPGHDDGTMSKMRFEMTDTVFDVQGKIDRYINENRDTQNANSTDKLIKFLLSVPGLVRFAVNIFKCLDRHGLLPKKIIDASPFHASMTVSNLASIRTNHIYHHLYEFGTTSVFITMGNMREVLKRKKEGVVYEKCLPLGVVMDERICSGSYYAQCFQRIRTYLNDPALLEKPPEKCCADEPFIVRG